MWDMLWVSGDEVGGGVEVRLMRWKEFGGGVSLIITGAWDLVDDFASL